MAEFKDRLKELRQARGWSQSDLAEELKVHKMTISGYERGIRRPDFEVLDNMAEKLDVNMDYLLGASDSRLRYPRHIIETKHDLTADAEKRARAYFKGLTEAEAFKAEKVDRMHQQILRAYDAADPGIQMAVRRLLGVDDGDR